jgi:hypothetical protein
MAAPAMWNIPKLPSRIQTTIRGPACPKMPTGSGAWQVFPNQSTAVLLGATLILRIDNPT